MSLIVVRTACLDCGECAYLPWEGEVKPGEEARYSCSKCASQHLYFSDFGLYQFDAGIVACSECPRDFEDCDGTECPGWIKPELGRLKLKEVLDA